jgi:hypothetical protein
MLAENVHICPANEKPGPAALTNKKRDNYDQIHADNIVKRSEFRIDHKKHKNIFFSGGGASEKVKNQARLS